MIIRFVDPLDEDNEWIMDELECPLTDPSEDCYWADEEFNLIFSWCQWVKQYELAWIEA